MTIGIYHLHSLKISPLKGSDIQKILKIHSESKLSDWNEKQYLEEIKRGDSIINTAILDCKMVGFIAARASYINGHISGESPEHVELDILNLGVVSKYRQQGVGTELLESIVRVLYVKNSSLTVWLEVRQSNSRAVDFYKNRGFVEMQIRKDFYRQPTENALVMRLILNNNP